MCLYFHQYVDGFGAEAIALIFSTRHKALGSKPLHDRCIIRIGGQHTVGGRCVGIADHAEKRMRHLLATNFPARVEYFVPAMLGVCLSEHHQFDVVGVAPKFRKLRAEVVNFVFGERESQGCIRLL